MEKIVDGDQDAFSAWCNNHDGNEYPHTVVTVVSIIERTRNRIREKFDLSNDELFVEEEEAATIA